MCVNTSKGAIIMLMHDGKLMFYYSVCWKYFYWATNCSMRQKLSLLVPQRDWSIAAGQIQTPNFTEKWTALKRNFRELLPHIHTSHDVFQQTYIYTLCQMLIQHNLLYLLCTRNIKEEWQVKKTPCCIFKSSGAHVGVSGAQRSGSAQLRSAPAARCRAPARTERRQAARGQRSSGKRVTRRGKHPPCELLLSSLPCRCEHVWFQLSLKLWTWTTN